MDAADGVLSGPRDLTGKTVLVTAGPTYEAIDPVRGVTNLSSGKMGFAICRAAREAGATVSLVAGPVSLATPRGVQRHDVRSAQQLLEATLALAPLATLFIATAAVADWRPDVAQGQKIKKDACGLPPELRFVENPDILATVAQLPRARSGELFCVGFAAESQDLLANAQAKRVRKAVPLLVDAQGATELPHASKLALARQLIADIARRLAC